MTTMHDDDGNEYDDDDNDGDDDDHDLYGHDEFIMNIADSRVVLGSYLALEDWNAPFARQFKEVFRFGVHL